ncbi:MAG: radical SAM protein [Coriobacteriales bacterium]|nr:radical SAM protein [Coriobacteriales bacterium]
MPDPERVRGGFFVHNLGCKLNRVESDSIRAALEAAGAVFVALDEASVVLVNSCTVTATADAKTRKAIRQALLAAARPWVIVTGCAVALEQEAFRRLGARVIVEPDRLCALRRASLLLDVADGAAGPRGLDRAAEPLRLDRAAEPRGVARRAKPRDVARRAKPRDVDGAALLPRGTQLRTGAGFPTRMGLKIQDGCDARCAYCIVTHARGRSRSESFATLLSQVQEAQRQGVREIVLTGINIGLYFSEGHDLVELLSAFLSVSEQPRFRLSSLEPQHATDELLNLMASSKGRICAHLHLPLQSGSDHVLEQMGRRYDTAFFRERVDAARKRMPQLGLTTDVICGFAGESEAQHEQSMEFCRQMGFMRMHVFRFSTRAGTPAAARHDHLPASCILERAGQMRALAHDLARTDAQGRVGTVELVLVEGQGWGRSESYHRVRIVPGEHAEGIDVSGEHAEAIGVPEGASGGVSGGAPADIPDVSGGAPGLMSGHIPDASASIPGSLEPMRFMGCRDTLIQATPLAIAQTI